MWCNLGNTQKKSWVKNLGPKKRAAILTAVIFTAVLQLERLTANRQHPTKLKVEGGQEKKRRHGFTAVQHSSNEYRYIAFLYSGTRIFEHQPGSQRKGGRSTQFEFFFFAGL